MQEVPKTDLGGIVQVVEYGRPDRPWRKIVETYRRFSNGMFLVQRNVFMRSKIECIVLRVEISDSVRIDPMPPS